VNVYEQLARLEQDALRALEGCVTMAQLRAWRRRFISKKPGADPCTGCMERQLENCSRACKAGTCPQCGGPLSHGDGHDEPPIYCAECGIGWNTPEEI